ncbi:MAG: two-component system regulatory protein YycI [Lachnospiraceae bacterium]|nr:two-component system regulatory protein YycI [Lachnospiraceae bacterium]
MKKSISKKMFALSVLMSAGILMTGCSGTAAEPSKSTLTGSSTEAMQGSIESVGGAESGTNYISEKLSDKLVIDAEVVLPKEQVYSVYALTEKAFPREDLDVFFGVSEAVVTDHPEWTGAYSAKTKEGGYFSTDPQGNFTYAKDEERDDHIVYLVESAYYNAGSCSFQEEEILDLSFLNAEEAIQMGKEKIKELTGQDSEVLAAYALNREKLTELEEKYRQTQKYQEDAQRGKATMVDDWSDVDEIYYMEYELTKDGLPIYSGINEPGISIAVETFWTAETRITMLLDKDGIRYIAGRGGIFDASPEAEAQTIISAEAALEAVKEIYVNTILSSQVTISRIWLEYVVVPEWKEKEQYKLAPYWCVQIDSSSGNSSVERINAITGGNLSYGE